MPGRPRAMPDEDLKARMFQAAGELLEQAGGFSLSLEHLNLETVMRRADVSRSAVYRVWPTKEDFNIELLEVLAAPSYQRAAALDEHTLVEAEKIIMSQPELLKDASGRRRVLEQAVRQAVWRNFDAVSRQPAWRTFLVLSLTLPSVRDDDRRERLAQRLRDSDEHFAAITAEFYRSVMPVLGLRPKPPFTNDNVHDLLAQIGGALVEGLAVHHGLDPDLGAQRFPGPGGDWSLPAIAFLAILDTLIEADPGYVAP